MLAAFSRIFPARRSRLLGLGVSLLGACQPSTPTEQATTPPPLPDSLVVAAPPAPPAPDTTNWLAARLPETGTTDTTFRIDGKPYRLRLSATADSAHMLRIATDGIVGPALAADSNFVRNQLVTGPAGRYRVVLTTATGQSVMQKEFHKPDFYKVMGADIVVSEPTPPRFLGYYPALGGLAFEQEIGIPGSDVGNDVLYLLDLQGQVRYLSRGNSFAEGRTDCSPMPAPRGNAFLTCRQLLRAGQPPLPLHKPHADLALARFLSDSTLLTIYQYGEYVVTNDSLGRPESMEWQVPPKMRNQPNAFVLNFRGQQLAAFTYDGRYEGMGYYVPRAYVPALRTYYLLDAEQGLRLLDARQPAATREVKFRQMTRSRPPQRSTEKRFILEHESARFVFYADKSHPERLRYQRLNNGG